MGDPREGDGNYERIKAFFEKHPDATDTAAGKKLGLAQGTVSRHHRALREELAAGGDTKTPRTEEETIALIQEHWRRGAQPSDIAEDLGVDKRLVLKHRVARDNTLLAIGASHAAKAPLDPTALKRLDTAILAGVTNEDLHERFGDVFDNVHVTIAERRKVLSAGLSAGSKMVELGVAMGSGDSTRLHCIELLEALDRMPYMSLQRDVRMAAAKLRKALGLADRHVPVEVEETTTTTAALVPLKDLEAAKVDAAKLRVQVSELKAQLAQRPKAVVVEADGVDNVAELKDHIVTLSLEEHRLKKMLQARG